MVKVTKQQLNSHLKNTDNSDEIIDSSILTDIENVNDDKTFSKDGNKMVWKANKDDVYYKGNTNKELPVDCKITYKQMERKFQQMMLQENLEKLKL